MPAFLITLCDDQDLVTEVFQSGETRAGLVFTGQKQAENYLASAGLEASHTVAELEEVPFLKWVLQAHGEGLTHLAVNPRFEQVAACQTVETLDIQAHLQHAAEHMLQLARPDF